jgi:hypothetical protein
MENAKFIRDYVGQCASMLTFDYHGKEGHVDPYYSPQNGYSYLLWFDGNEQLVYSLDAVMDTPFWDGHSLNEIADECTDFDW